MFNVFYYCMFTFKLCAGVLFYIARRLSAGSRPSQVWCPECVGIQWHALALSCVGASQKEAGFPAASAMTEIMEHARRESFEQDQERYNKILESQKAQRDAQMDDINPLSERTKHLCSPRRLPALFRFAAIAILFVGLLFTIRAVNDGATMDTAVAKTLPGPDSVHRSRTSPPAPSTSLSGSSPPPANVAAPSVAPQNAAPPSSPGSVFVYLGNGCFWERQWAYVEVETHAWQRAAVNVSSKVGYAGGSKAGASGRVCYHCGLVCPDDYSTLGHSEVVQVRLAADGLHPKPKPYPKPKPKP